MSSENNLDIEKTLTCILQNIKEIDVRIPQQESATIVVGKTRERKTTSLNYLTGISLSSKESNGFGGFEIYVVDSLNNADINNGSTSQTSLPYNRGKYWDCPGFGDICGPVHTEKLKVLVVVSEATISETSKEKLLNLIQQMENMRNGLLKILKEREGKEGFSSSQRNILEFLSSDRSQIAFFDAPQEEGPISDEDKSEILNCIEKITYIKNLEPSISIGSYAKSFIRNLIEKFYNDMDEFISQKFDSAFLNHIKDLIDHHDDTVENFPIKFIKQVKPETLNIQGNTKSWYHVITKLIKIIDHLKSEPTPESNNNDIFIDEDIKAPGIILILISPQLRVVGEKREINLKGNPGPSHYAEKANDGIKEIINKQTYENETNDNINKDANNEINKNMNEIEKIEEEIIEKETIDGVNKDVNNEINILKDESDNEKIDWSDEEIIGEQITCDKIKEKETIDRINKNANNEINILKDESDNVNDEINEKQASNGINKDANCKLHKNINEVEANNRNLKKKTLRLLKKKRVNEIKTEKTIDLINNVTRENEISDEINIINKKEASSKMHGKDGLPGNSGYNGGQFYAKERNFINLSSLTIDISGGDGGKGQDGGNGADGLDGSDCGIKIVEERKKSFLFSRKKVSGDLKEIEGGNSGRGGVGSDVGSYGIDGERGSPGRGRKNGPKYCGIYINELVFSGFRGYEEFDTKSTGENADFKELDTKSTDDTVDFKEFNTKFVDGVRVATNATISMATGLTAAVGCTIADTAAKNAVTFAIKKVSKNAIKISPLTGASFVAGRGVKIAIPLIMSPVSAHFSSYWEKSHIN
ncbi:3457_t:CDS:10 [Gigaspora margarita]|uniref:3457_t:CDS:1 n=1 Tax=Gigaspora margarita TaxID=4874 RepID=A0ABN7USB7_GIGMA|nr:3457_t:CDS:10 [Gigaspora margarita]